MGAVMFCCSIVRGEHEDKIKAECTVNKAKGIIYSPTLTYGLKLWVA